MTEIASIARAERCPRCGRASVDAAIDPERLPAAIEKRRSAFATAGTAGCLGAVLAPFTLGISLSIAGVVAIVAALGAPPAAKITRASIRFHCRSCSLDWYDDDRLGELRSRLIGALNARTQRGIDNANVSIP